MQNFLTAIFRRSGANCRYASSNATGTPFAASSSGRRDGAGRSSLRGSCISLRRSDSGITFYPSVAWAVIECEVRVQGAVMKCEVNAPTNRADFSPRHAAESDCEPPASRPHASVDVLGGKPHRNLAEAVSSNMPYQHFIASEPRMLSRTAPMIRRHVVYGMLIGRSCIVHGIKLGGLLHDVV